MIEIPDIIAKVQAKAYPASWRVVRASARSFIASGALVLFAAYAFINDLSSKTSVLAHAVPIPTLTWDVPTGSGFVLTVVVLGLIFGGLFWQYQRQRQEVLVFTPDGFVQMNVRTGRARRVVDYKAHSALALREAPEGEFELVPRIHFEFTDTHNQETIWRIENFYALPPAEIARIVFADFMHIQTRVLPAGTPPEEEAPPEQLVALWRAGQKPDHWRIYTPKLGWTAYLGPLVVLGVGVAILVGLVVSYFTPGQTLADRFNSGRPFGDVLAAELVTLIGTPLLLVFIGTLLFIFLRKARMARMVFIITQTRWIAAWRRSGKVVQMLRYADVAPVKLTYWYKSFTLFYRTPDGKRQTIVMAADSLKSPALVCQSFLGRYYRQRARLGQS